MWESGRRVVWACILIFVWLWDKILVGEWCCEVVGSCKVQLSGKVWFSTSSQPDKNLYVCACLCVHVWSYAKCLWSRYVTNHFWGFHQIQSIRTVGDKDELIIFSGKKVKSQGHSEDKSTFPAEANRSTVCCWPPSSSKLTPVITS